MKTYNIIQAVYKGDFTLDLFFSDNTVTTVNFKPFLEAHPHPQFEKYTLETNFKKFRIENGNVVWGDDWDLIFPLDQLHKGSISLV